jgi:helix-turn-helix protein
MRGWFDLKDAADHCSLSVRTLRRYIGDAQHPLPVRMVGGKCLVSQDELDAWVSGFPRAGEDVDTMVNEVLRDLHQGERPRWKQEGPRRRAP